MRASIQKTLLLLLAILIGALADSNNFTYPPANGEILYIPSGTPLTIEWNCSYDNLNLRLFQLNSDGSYNYSTILCKSKQ